MIIVKELELLKEKIEKISNSLDLLIESVDRDRQDQWFFLSALCQLVKRRNDDGKDLGLVSKEAQFN
jgi:hypothetical protein